MSSTNSTIVTERPFPTYPNNRGIIFAGISAAVVAVWFAYLQVAHPDRVRSAAQHAEQHHGVAPLDEQLDYAPADSEPGRPIVSG